MIRHLFIALFLLLSLMQQVQGAPQAKMAGVLEQWTYDQATRQIRLQGWVLAGTDGQALPTLTVTVLKEQLQARDIAWAERPDVSPSNPVTEGQVGKGFDFSVTLSEAAPPGSHPMRLEAAFPDGHRATLPSMVGWGPELVVQKIRGRHWRTLVGTLVAIAVIYFGVIRRQKRWARISRWFDGRGPYWVVGSVFALLVAMGVSGSSFGVMLGGPFGQSIMEAQGDQRRISSLRDVRGDEWGVLIPNVLAQIHHQPPFPVVNSNIGLSGQNMGVAGMTGVPVQQWAALAKPATWGYFFLPLRQAMSLQWQLPFWGCLLALWCLLNVLRPERRGLNFALSLAFCLAPYAAAWSNWPLYATMFPALGFVLMSRLLTEQRIGRALLWGAAMGWAGACWFLVLYPPWLIVVGSLLALVGAGWCIDQRANLRWGSAQLGGLLLAGAVVAALLGSWWLDTREAIALMQATEYPGKRVALQGGDMTWWQHLRGYSGMEIVLRHAGSATNQSEASSYFFLPLLLVALLAWHLVRTPARRWAVAGCGVFMACFWIYSLIGIPLWLAKATLWGHMPPGRMDVGLGLASVLLIALVVEPQPAAGRMATGIAHKAKAWALPVLVALGSAANVAWVLQKTPPVILPSSSVVYIASMAIAGVAACWWMMRGRVGASVAVLLFANLATTLAFNPVGWAPKSVSLAREHLPFVSDPKDSSRRLRTLVVNGDGIGPMTFAAVGIPVANGVLYYPHAEFWKRMRLPADKWPTVNRYQHLGFYFDTSVAEPDAYRVIAPSVDQLRVEVHPEKFDFALTGAERVAALSDVSDSLLTNPSLKHLGHFKGLHWFAVRPLEGAVAAAPSMPSRP